MKDIHKYWNDHSRELYETTPNISGSEWNEAMYTWLESFLIDCKDHYYKGNPLISDREYDSFENRLRDYKPNSPVLSKVGYTIKRDKE